MKEIRQSGQFVLAVFGIIFFIGGLIYYLLSHDPNSLIAEGIGATVLFIILLNLMRR